MKIRSAEITMSAINRSQYPAEGIPEIALVGRSNVGKSSTVNTLLNRRNFARSYFCSILLVIILVVVFGASLLEIISKYMESIQM